MEKEQKQVQRSIRIQDSTVRTFEITPEMMEDIKESVKHELRIDREFRRSIVCEALGTTDEVLSLKQDDEVKLQEVDTKEAVNMIQEFIQSNPGCRTSDLITNLQLPPQQVMEILKELKKEDLVQSKEIGQ